MPKPPRITYTDETPMPWGDHKGVAMKDVPTTYLLWLLRQSWIKDWPDVYAYLLANQAALLEEEGEESPGGTDGFESMDDYMRYGRD